MGGSAWRVMREMIRPAGRAMVASDFQSLVSDALDHFPVQRTDEPGSAAIVHLPGRSAFEIRSAHRPFGIGNAFVGWALPTTIEPCRCEHGFTRKPGNVTNPASARIRRAGPTIPARSAGERVTKQESPNIDTRLQRGVIYLCCT